MILMNECSDSLRFHVFGLDVIEVSVVLITVRAYSLDKKFIYQKNVVDCRITCGWVREIIFKIWDQLLREIALCDSPNFFLIFCSQTLH